MNKRGIVTAIVLIVLFSSATSTLSAQPYKMALGIRISSPDAAVNHSASFKYFFKEQLALETLLSFGDSLALGVLVEKHKPVLSNRFNWIIGAGAYFGRSMIRRGGMHAILGLDYKVPALPLNFSIDWKPELNLTKEFSFEPAVLGFSARFTLK